MATDTRHKHFVVGSLSVAHEVPAALGTIMAPTLFVKQFDMPIDQLYLFALPLIVTAFKWVWSPLVDRFGSARFGRRLSWIVPSAAIVALLYCVMAMISPSLDTLLIVIALFVVIKIFFSTYEIAADAYVVEALTPEEQGSGSGAVWFGKELGQVIGLAGLLVMADIYGWMAAFLAAGCLFMLLNLIALSRKEAPVRRPTEDSRASIWTYLKEPVNRRLLVLIFAFAFAVQIPSAIIGPFLSDKGLTLSEVGATVGISASLGAGISLLVATAVIRRIGVKSMAWVTLGLSALAFPPFLWLSFQEEPSLWVVLAVIFWGALMAAPVRMTFYAARLRWTGPEQAGTDFTLQQSAWFLGYGATLAASGFIASALGWSAVFVLMGVLVAIVILLFIGMFDRFTIETEALHADKATAFT
ncbi:MAG: MFS transporter [Pseudomonadota bacterium]